MCKVEYCTGHASDSLVSRYGSKIIVQAFFMDEEMHRIKRKIKISPNST